MAITLKIYKDTVAFDLLSVAELEQYRPVVAALGEETVTESATLTFTGGNSAVDGNITTLMELFWAARQYAATGVGGRVRLELGLDLSGLLWRADLLTGLVDFGDGMLGYERANGQRQVVVTWTREAVWESTTPTPLAMSNANGTNTAMLRVWNVNDGVGASPDTRTNYVTVAGSTIAGDSPAPVQVQLTARSASNNLMEVILTVNHSNSPLTVVDFWEAESFTGGATVVAAGRSGGATQQLTAISTSAYSTIARNLAGFPGAYFNGGAMKFMTAVYADTAQGYYFKPYWSDGINTHYGSVVYRKWTASNWQLLDLGTLRIPAISPAAVYPKVTLGVAVKAETSVGSVQFDFLQATTADYVASSMGLQGGLAAAVTATLDFDLFGNAIWYDPLSTNTAIMRMFGGGIYAVPGYDMRMTINTCGYITVAGEHDLRKYDLAALYFPRRRALV